MKYVLITLTLIIFNNSYASNNRLSSTVILTSDYVYRGLSQSNGNPVIQFMPKFNVKNGWHMVGFFASVDYGGKNQANFEFDLALGFESQEGDLYWNARLWRFNYRDQKELNTTEFRVFAKYNILDFTYGFTNDISSTGAYAHHFELGLTQQLWNKYRIRGHIGHSTFEDNPAYKDYYHFKLSLSRNFNGVDLGLSYSNTHKGVYGKLDDARFFIHLNKTF